jgi:PAS domain S-box-containing protein
MDVTDKTILLVEDEVIQSMLGKNALEKCGYRVVTALSGEKAVEAIQNDPAIDLILMDIDLGKGIDGTQTAEIILRIQEIPIVFLSSHTEPEIVEKTEKITSYGYVAKNSAITVLDASIKMAFKLYEATNKYEIIFDLTPALIAVAGTDGYFKELNADWEKTLGYTIEELKNRPFADFLHPEDLERTNKEVSDQLAGSKTMSFINRYRHKNGSYRYFQWRAIPSKKGVLYASAIDITDRKQIEDSLQLKNEEYEALNEELKSSLEELKVSTEELQGYSEEIKNQNEELIKTDEALLLSNKKYESLFLTMLEGVALHEIICDADGKPSDYRFLDLNPAFERLTGLKKQEVINRTVLSVMPGTEAIWIEKYGRVALTGEPVSFENYSEALEKYFHVDVFSPEKYKFAVIFSDITERKKLAAELEAKNEEHERLNEELNATLEELQQSTEEVQKQNVELLRSEVTLREQAARLTRAERITKTGNWTLRMDTGKFISSKGLNEIFGMDGEEMDLSSFRNLLLDEYKERIDKALSELIHADAPHDIECRIRRATDGKILDIRSIADYDRKTNTIFGVVSETTNQKEIERQLEETNEYLENLINYANAPIIVWDTQFRITKFNHAFELISGRAKKDILGSHIQILFPPDQVESSMDLIKETQTGERWEVVEIDILHVDGTVHTLLWNSATLFSPEGKNPLATIAQGQDITERKRAEEVLREREEDLRESQRNAHIGSWRMITATNQVVWSEELYRMYGFDPSLPPPPYTEHMKLFTDTSWKMLSAALASTAETGIPYDLELETKRRDGTNGWMWVYGKTVKDGLGKTVGLMGFAQDISERKIAENKIKSLLAEKELTLKEVHHRIKNNMSTICGLLDLQAGAQKERVVSAALKEATGRVKSMQLLYEKLYQSVQYTELPVKEYLTPLIDEIISNFSNQKGIRVEKKIGDFVLTARQLQPLGIIVNELLTNIMKYAFTGRDGGTITISAFVDDGRVSLAVEDNGNGMPDSVSFERSTGFGLVLVSGLTAQLGGAIRIERGNGTRIVLEFKK